MKTRRPGKGKSRVGRSPAYPFIPLQRAIARAEELWRAAGATEMDGADARHHWGYRPNSSGGSQTEAALKQFGLLEVSGKGNKRWVKLSELALRLVGDRVVGSSERYKFSHQAALNPRIHREMWERWGSPLPEAEVRRYLVTERIPGFNSKAANHLIAEYQQTISYTELLDSKPLLLPQASDKGPEGGREVIPIDPPTVSSGDSGGDSPQIAPPKKENEISVQFFGDFVRVSAFVDRVGRKELIKMLKTIGPK
jgi:hypothetical protein